MTLYQFPIAHTPNWQVGMATLPSDEPVPNFGMGLTAYIIGDLLPKRKNNESLRETIEKIVQIPMASKLYIRPTWRQMQSQRGRLDMFAHWQITLELAEKYNKRVGFRIMLNNPDSEEEVLPDFVLANVPQHTFEGKWECTHPLTRQHESYSVPHYHHPWFLEALEEFDALLAEQDSGHAGIEHMDAYMHGFWGEGHAWPFETCAPFPNHETAAATWLRIFEMQRAHWNQTPLVANLQPDINNYRPPHIAFVSEVGMSDGTPESLQVENGVPLTENIIAHVKDVGVNYWSLWDWHNIHAEHVMNYYRQYPEGIDRLNRVIGYCLRPAWIWTYGEPHRAGLIGGLANDGINGVPGVVRLTLLDQDQHPISESTLERSPCSNLNSPSSAVPTPP